MELRPYQLSAIHSTRLGFARGSLRQVIYSPTGSGKTEIGIELIRGALAKGKRVAFVANRIGLVGQTSLRLHAAGIQHGIIQGENSRSIHESVLVCSIQTIARRGIPPVDVIVIDEAHGCPGSKDYRKFIFSHNALPVIGLTATPFAKGMAKNYPELDGPLFEGLVIASTIQDLIGMGFLVDVEIYAPSVPDLSGVKVQKNSFGEMDYSEKDLAVAVDKASLIGDIVTHWKKLGGDQPTVCFATSIAHSKHIAEQFNAEGIAAEHLDCYTEEAERAAILERVRTGVTRVVSNVGILTEGWDFPACSVMILARPTKSLIRWIQMVGRILRPFPGKTHGIVLDHSGSAFELGYPTDDLPLELDEGTPKRASKKQPEERLPKKCPACHFMKPAKIHACPKCGFAPEAQANIQAIEGDLLKLDRKRAKPGEKQAVYSQLLFIAQKRGYRDGWIANNYRDYFGVWPKGLNREPMEPSEDVKKFITHKLIRFAHGGKHAA